MTEFFGRWQLTVVLIVIGLALILVLVNDQKLAEEGFKNENPPTLDSIVIMKALTEKGLRTGDLDIEFQGAYKNTRSYTVETWGIRWIALCTDSVEINCKIYSFLAEGSSPR